MNLPDRSLFTPKREWTVMRVIEKASGQIIAIKDYRFNPEIHEVLNGQPLTLSTPLPVEPVDTAATATTAIPVAPVTATATTEEKPFLHEASGKRFRTLQGLKQYETKLAKGQVS